jgi:hypothetical protein
VGLLFRRLHEKLDQIDATIDRNTRAFERSEQAFSDFQLAFRQDRLRAERVYQEQLAATMEVRASIAEMRDEIRANTQAILRMLDRWGEGPSPAS